MAFKDTATYFFSGECTLRFFVWFRKAIYWVTFVPERPFRGDSFETEPSGSAMQDRGASHYRVGRGALPGRRLGRASAGPPPGWPPGASPGTGEA